MNLLQTVTLGLHGVVVVLLLALAVVNYRGTGNLMSVIPAVVMALLVGGLGVSVGRLVARRS